MNVLLMSDKGTGYSEGFYFVKDGRIINSSNNKVMGIFVDKVETLSFFLPERKTIKSTILKWWKKNDELNRKIIERNILPEDDELSLIETMQLLKDAK